MRMMLMMNNPRPALSANSTWGFSSVRTAPTHAEGRT